MEQPWIASPAAAEALAFAQRAPGGSTAPDPLRLGAELERRFGLAPEQRAAVLTQAELRRRAAARWGEPVDGLWFTRDGLEQATRPALARWRAQRLRGFGVRAIADLGCGLGMESRAMAGAGLQVTAIEIDADTAVLAACNLAGLGVQLHIGDITDERVLEAALAQADAVFLDPARRDPMAPRSVDGLTGHRVNDPSQWSPPWPWIERLAARLPRTVVKVAPGIDHALIPDGGSAVWAEVDGDLVEASLWFDGFAGQPQRSALSISAAGEARMLDSSQPTSERVTAVGAHLLDVAPVVTRSHLVTTLAASIDAARIDEHIGFLTTDAAPAPSPFHTAYRVLDVMPFDRKRVGAAIAAHGASSLTVMKRGLNVDTEQLRRQWLGRGKGGTALVVALTRIGDAATAIICAAQPYPARTPANAGGSDGDGLDRQ